MLHPAGEFVYTNREKQTDEQFMGSVTSVYGILVSGDWPGVPAELAPTEWLRWTPAPPEKECEWPRPAPGPGWKENEELTLRGELGTRRPENVSEVKKSIYFNCFPCLNLSPGPGRMDLRSSEGVWGWEKHLVVPDPPPIGIFTETEDSISSGYYPLSHNT